jgi:hypothetical protein
MPSTYSAFDKSTIRYANCGSVGFSFDADVAEHRYIDEQLPQKMPNVKPSVPRILSSVEGLLKNKIMF